MAIQKTEPQQKSLEVPPFLLRIPTVWQNPRWAEATQWRWFVYNQPVAMLCRFRLINYLQGLPWEIVARDESQKNALEEDINYYEKWVLREFDTIVDQLWQDALDLPIGGNLEIIRWPADVLPIIQEGDEEYRATKKHPKGHVFKLVHIDGATLFPTFDNDFPIAQKIPEAIFDTVYFSPGEIGRILIQPRTEMRLKGYGKAPPEQIYLAMQMTSYADHYYADLLKNVPPVGILDLMDMAQSSAQQWASSVRTLFEGTDSFKIPVLYEHEKAAAFIPFGKSPQEMLFDAISYKYARITAASYGLTLGNIGLEPKGETLAGSIRDDQQAATGYGTVVEKTKGLIDNQILPPYLEWIAKDTNFEKATGKGRAFLVTAQALKTAKEAGALLPSEVQAQLVHDGFITVEVETPDDEPKLPMLPFSGNGKNGNNETNEQAKQIEDKKPPEQGGRGDITGKSSVVELAQYKYASTQFDMPDHIIKQVLALSEQIDPSDLHEEGIEDYPHVTVKYGLLSDETEPVKKIAKQFNPFYITTSITSFFENKDFDVLKIEIESDTLRQLNKAIATLGSVDTQKTYNPHLTIAYVKPGLGQKYLDLVIPPQNILVSVLSFSSSDGDIIKIPLGDTLMVRAELGDNEISATPVSSKYYDQLAQVFLPALSSISEKVTTSNLEKLIKSATSFLFPKVEKRENEIDHELDQLLSMADWYELREELAQSITPVLQAAFSEGAVISAELIQQALFSAGMVDAPSVGISFDLKNPETIAQIKNKAALLVRRVNDGTRFYLREIIKTGVTRGLASPVISDLIKSGIALDAILSDAGYINSVVEMVKDDLLILSKERVSSIVNTEINRAESEGRLKQWQEMGLTKKAWRTHTGACPICKGNEALGFVEMDYVYDDVFDGTLTPPGHPQVCRCHLVFDEQELLEKADTLEIWTGD